ncbi:cobalamin biosynthesis protein CobG [Rhodococcus ruber]|uniref:Cobalamin biosynthesis protein CobG, precorrin-3B synthase n=1 Tax=Rhodococcus ruber TaxID=1830 RepID=A0A098BHB6_9NOCA|nr:cobalamin biosynthesis protein CobG [Rhodococcus ruber]MCD2127340.1 cobalamin biosynthesis protein CobG [Rhodococcus ruber]MCZ4503989.1 cobalamin biosynthesis protein CobG [Rhodococcus ruber]MCZ4531074.1 cobalamin biosynthesis protein CobG [Rhodococcus ruber]MCZ4621785.1 cobalamin biosynthesis protein CobG [Rhodococcus ruber]MDI9967450.1 cobalamin biosynthesis protein CobG [Rhodococcus ruber]
MVDLPPAPAQAASPVAALTQDRCPGLLRPHLASDGALVRLRAPGGRLPDGGLQALSEASVAFADGDVHLTSRGNLQIRGVALDECGGVPAGLVEAVTAAGFLPAPSHERVRNLVASPLSGITGGRADIRPLIGALDAALCAEPALAQLPGRFLFGLDDGRGDVTTLRCDLAAVAVEPGLFRVTIGRRSGPVVPAERAVGTLVDLAQRFAAIRGTSWHVHRLPEAGAELGGGAPLPPPTRYTAPYGPLPGAVSVLVPLGILSPAMVAALPVPDVIVTPWRGLVLPGEHDPQPLRDAGFVLDGASPWTRTTACTGAPRCSLAGGDTRATARRVVADAPPPGHLHVVGCERSCGAPNFPHTLLLARNPA